MEGIRPKVELIHNLEVEYSEVERNIEFLHEITISEENVLDNIKKNTAIFIILFGSGSRLKRSLTFQLLSLACFICYLVQEIIWHI